MKRMIALFVLSMFVLGNLQLVFAKDQEIINILDKKESLKEITINLKDYLDSTKERIESSSLIPESENPVVIRTLEEKSAKITNEYFYEIESITTIDDIKKIKSKLKDDIKEIKKVVEKPVIKIQKSRISNVISKLKTISMKLSLVMPALGESEKEKIKELKSLIDSANKKLEKAEKLSNSKYAITNSNEIKSLLEEATKEIKLAFGIVRDLLSQMESDLLYDITGNQDVDKDNKKKDKYDYCPFSYVMAWYDEYENLIRKEDYNVFEDECTGFRSLKKSLPYEKSGLRKVDVYEGEISPSCYSEEQCNELNLKCVSVKELRRRCDNIVTTTDYGTESQLPTSSSEESIQNIYVNLNEIFSLEKGQSAKLISKIRNGDNSTTDESIVITLKQITSKGAGTNVNYIYGNSYISNKYDFLKKDEKISIDKYELKMISLGRSEAKYVIKYKDVFYEDEYDSKINIVLATGDTVYGVKLLAVDINEKSCTIEYNGKVYTINKGDYREMDNGRKIKIEKVMPISRADNLDYCEIEIYGD